MPRRLASAKLVREPERGMESERRIASNPELK